MSKIIPILDITLGISERYFDNTLCNNIQLVTQEQYCLQPKACITCFMIGFDIVEGIKYVETNSDTGNTT